MARATAAILALLAPAVAGAQAFPVKDNAAKYDRIIRNANIKAE